MKALTTCGLCHRTPTDGHGTAHDDNGDVVHLCHPDDKNARDCYHQWTVYGERPTESP